MVFEHSFDETSIMVVYLVRYCINFCSVDLKLNKFLIKIITGMKVLESSLQAVIYLE